MTRICSNHQSLLRWLLPATFAFAALLFAADNSAMAQEKTAGGIKIIPATKILTSKVDPLGNVKTHVKGVSYADVYSQIPFSRSEYNANPSYRHEATMRILFGQLFPNCCGSAGK